MEKLRIWLKRPCQAQFLARVVLVRLRPWFVLVQFKLTVHRFEKNNLFFSSSFTQKHTKLQKCRKHEKSNSLRYTNVSFNGLWSIVYVSKVANSISNIIISTIYYHIGFGCHWWKKRDKGSLILINLKLITYNNVHGFLHQQWMGYPIFLLCQLLHARQVTRFKCRF